jgi:TetR/AcrR family transcriptional regulator
MDARMAADNRTVILTHALRLFSARGYDAAGVQEIVAAAGVTKPTLYHYFGSKAGLLEALLARYFEGLVARATEAAAYDHNITLTLRRVTEAYFSYAQAHPAFYRMQLAMVFAAPDSDPYRAVVDWQARQYAIIEDLFLRAAEDHGNMRGRHRRYAVSLRGMIDTHIILWLNGHVTLDDELMRLAVHQFMHGIFS